jgi:hypothetical protein
MEQKFFKGTGVLLIAVNMLNCGNNAGLSENAVQGRVFQDTIVCMAYNVENLFDLVENGEEYAEFRPGECNWNRETCDTKFDNISSAIAAAKSDIVALCEVENRNALDMLIDELRRKNRVYRFSVIADQPVRSSTCPAILSVFPVVSVRYHEIDLPDSSVTRNILEADILCGACTLKVFVNHWPSRHNPESDRIAAAEVLKNRLAQLSTHCDYVAAGDFNVSYNDFYQERTIGPADRPEISGLHDVLQTVRIDDDGRKQLVTKSDVCALPDGSYLYDLWLELEQQRRYSYVFQKKPQTPDHIILPSSMFDRKSIDYADGSFHVFRWNGRLLFDGKPYRWKMDYTKQGKRHAGFGYSDHLPLIAKFVYNRPTKLRLDMISR